MIDNEDLRDHVLSFLNGLLEHEPQAVVELVEHRVSVGKKLLDSKEPVVVEVDNPKGPGPQYPRLGMLGVINGILGHDHRICAVFEDDGTISSFKPVPTEG